MYYQRKCCYLCHKILPYQETDCKICVIIWLVLLICFIQIKRRGYEAIWETHRNSMTELCWKRGIYSVHVCIRMCVQVCTQFLRQIFACREIWGQIVSTDLKPPLKVCIQGQNRCGQRGGSHCLNPIISHLKISVQQVKNMSWELDLFILNPFCSFLIHLAQQFTFFASQLCKIKGVHLVVCLA